MSRYAITALHSEQVGRRFRKGAGETHPLSEFLVGFWLWLLSRKRGEHEH